MKFSKLNFGESMLQIMEGYKDFSGLSGVQGAIDATENPHTGSVCKDLHMFNPLSLVWRLAEFCCGSKSVPRHNCIT
jgi:hypothetical protein